MKLFRNQTGFTLVETLLAIGISTGAALIVYKVLGDFQRGQVLVEHKDDINQIHREIIGKFNDRFACTNTLKEGMKKDLPSFKLEKILSDKDQPIQDIPFTFGKITLTELNVTKVDKDKNVAEIQATYQHKVAGKDIQVLKVFRVELSVDNGQFAGCISRGTLGLDPKEACDLVVGHDKNEASYFYNGKCNFDHAACEQGGRVWNPAVSKCNLSEEDLEALRKEICSTLSQDYSPEIKKCLPSKELIEAIDALKIMIPKQ